MKGYVYKIGSSTDDKIYIGSTTQQLKSRFISHKSKMNDLHSNCTSEIILRKQDPYIELIEEVEFNDKEELRTRERFHIEQNQDKVVNKCRPIKTKQDEIDDDKEKYQKNKEEIKRRTNTYYHANKEICLEKQKVRYDTIKNNEEYKRKKRDYYDRTKDIQSQKRAEKITCECGAIVSKRNIAPHRKSKSHQEKTKI